MQEQETDHRSEVSASNDLFSVPALDYSRTLFLAFDKYQIVADCYI